VTVRTPDGLACFAEKTVGATLKRSLGVLVLGHCRCALPPEAQVVVELSLRSLGGRRAGRRAVRCRCHVAHISTLGRIRGIGLKFLEKLA